MGFFFYVLLYNIGAMKDTTHNNFPIDLVIAYVNNQDPIWRNNYINYCKTHNLNNLIVNLAGSRYGGINFLYDQLKLANKNMPWLNKIYLLLSNKEQVIPSLLPPNVKIIYHHNFIYNQYLPTFNSCTIEMFLWNIPNLSEHFIYANDDMLPTGKLKPSDFFSDGKIKIKWKNSEFNFNCSMFAYQCRNNIVYMNSKLGNKENPDDLLRPIHSFTPMIKSHCKEIFNLLEYDIKKHIRVFRTTYQVNQYIYPLYEHYKYGTLDSDIDFLYTELESDFDLKHQIVCVNGEKKKEYIDKYVKEIRQLCE